MNKLVKNPLWININGLGWVYSMQYIKKEIKRNNSALISLIFNIILFFGLSILFFTEKPLNKYTGLNINYDVLVGTATLGMFLFSSFVSIGVIENKLKGIIILEDGAKGLSDEDGVVEIKLDKNFDQPLNNFEITKLKDLADRNNRKDEFVSLLDFRQGKLYKIDEKFFLN